MIEIGVVEFTGLNLKDADNIPELLPGDLIPQSIPTEFEQNNIFRRVNDYLLIASLSHRNRNSPAHRGLVERTILTNKNVCLKTCCGVNDIKRRSQPDGVADG